MRMNPSKFIGAILLFSFIGFVWGSDGHAVEDPRFVVETDEESVVESLNRISGDSDRGYSLPEQSYQSDHHHKAGAFQRSEEISDQQNSSGRY